MKMRESSKSLTESVFIGWFFFAVVIVVGCCIQNFAHRV